MTALRVLVVGGTGTFGTRLVHGLAETTTLGIVVAGRDLGRAEALAGALRARHPGRDISALALNAAQMTAEALRATGAFALVDAAGPWQGAGYHLPRAALAAGMHAIDLSDAREHVAGFAAALDEEARGAGRLALTGASSTPALSNAVLDHLLRGWRQVDTVEVAISPGNRAPRGHSVVRAILSYAGRPVRVFGDGHWRVQPGWGMLHRRPLPGLGRRWLSLCDTPDLDLIPARFAPRRAAIFRAGLELAPLHFGLWLASLAGRAGLNLARFSGAFRWLAAAFDRFGTDRGGMLVEARGRDAEGLPTLARWMLLAEAGDGPMVPTLPALAVLRALAEGRLEGRAGASACVGVVDLAAIEAEFTPYRIRCTSEVSRPLPLFALTLGAETFARLPEPLRALHRPGWWQAASGMAEVDGPSSRLAALVARLVGFPSPGRMPVRVEIEATDEGERWTRHFGPRRFTSRLSASRSGHLTERFGPFAFDLALPCDAKGMRLELQGWRCLGIPLPRRLAPLSDAKEEVDAAGRFTFDVEISLPLRLGRIVRYRGWLVPERA
ncbi:MULTISPECIES: DUF4166 domain-containing protein [Roseomonadaceae]|uniref:DUF4166 domain-containing protein n=1 Tax=Falsiroseomonas oleicola TaxID=2801474 RepID=A0ABS6H4L2_9PROT|nr:SDR family oxidoreductase [Roseomonas oleicola]MBU8542441.1 DUF4166 domain-containing protein [Roseomonas oleicola]